MSSGVSGKRVHIGSICYRGSGHGGHVALVGNSDYGACGSKHYAEIYVEIEVDPDYQGEVMDVEDVASAIAAEVTAAEAHDWCDYEDGGAA